MFVSKLIDYLLPINQNDDDFSNWKNRTFIAFILVMTVLAAIMHISITLGIYFEAFPYLVLSFYFLCILLFFKKTGNVNLSINLCLVATIVLIAFNAHIAGGIYSYNLKWIVIPIMISFLFSELKFSLFWMGVCTLLLVVYFLTYSDTNHQDAFEISASNYFIDNLMFFITFCFLIYLFYSAHVNLNKVSNEKNILLEKQKKALKLKTDELNTITEKLKSSNQKLERYAYTTAHDLQQPIRSIANFTQLVQRDVVAQNISPKTHSNLDYVISSSKQLSHKVSGLLALAKNNNGVKIERESISLKELVMSVTGLLDTQIKEAGIKIEIANLPVVPLYRTQIESLMQNLISNALKFSKSNESSFIKIYVEERHSDYLFCVHDNGIGIKKENLERIFEAFHQLNEEKYSGTGIGLSTCKIIVENHGGSIWAESEYGSFTKFFFTLPK